MMISYFLGYAWNPFFPYVIGLYAHGNNISFFFNRNMPLYSVLRLILVV
jgi:hypothetical protein